MNCLVIGYGSIGQRHAWILHELDCKVSVVSKRGIDYPSHYYDLYTALRTENPDYIVIANQTSEHYNVLAELINYDYRGTVLVEKPLYHVSKQIPNNKFRNGFVGYNLRFHPIIKKLKEIIQDEDVIFAEVYVGQYLPNWRPNSDYRRSYSAKKDKGGGVLLDLSHELDYIRWFFEDWSSLVSLGGKYSSLEIDSCDLYSIMLTMNKCELVQVHLNYLDKIHRRDITIITDNHTIKADLIKQNIQIDNDLFDYDVERDYSYIMEHKAIINGNYADLCTLEDGLKTLELINYIEQSSNERKWIYK